MGENIYLRISDINDSGRLNREGLTSPAADLDAGYQVKSGDLLFARTGASVGRNYLYDEEDGRLYFAGFLIKFPIEKAVPFFVYLSMQQVRYRKWVKAVSMRSGQPGINAKEYAAYSFSIPQIDEQQKIAKFLTAADKWIENLKAQKGKWEEYKNGMMQKIFPSTGSGQVSEIRFKPAPRSPKGEVGDEDGNEFPDWEEKRLGEVAKIIMGQSPDSSSYNQKGEGRVLVQGNADLMRGQIYPRVWMTQPSKCSEVGDIIMTVRAPVGDIAWSSNNVCLGRGVCAIRTGDSLDAGYIYQWFLNFGQRWLRFGQGSMFSAVNSKDVSGLKFRLPSFPEQQKIAGFLTAAALRS